VPWHRLCSGYATGAQGLTIQVLQTCAQLGAHYRYCMQTCAQWFATDAQWLTVDAEMCAKGLITDNYN